jgi:1-acyl-sn-glycerol-3-phosphate acyltransferase
MQAKPQGNSVSALRAALRVLRVVGVVAYGWWWSHFRSRSLDAAARQRDIAQWAKNVLDAIGLGLEVRGTPPLSGPVLLVANHISWLDVVVLLASCPCRFVAKSEVHHWPIVGAMASAAHTLFIERESARDAMRVMHHMASALADGDVVAVFPEGTTSNGATVMPFHANLFQAAIASKAPVQGVALTYLDPIGDNGSHRIAYVGDDSMLDSLWRTAKSQHLRAVAAFGEPFPCDGKNRRQMAGQLEVEVLRLHTEVCGLV